MSILSTFRAAIGQSLPWAGDDSWYNRKGSPSSSGMEVSPDSAMRLAAVYSCVHVRSETLGSVPLIIYRRLPDGGKERASDHPLYKVLHDTPNQWQTALEFIEMMQAHLDLRGNAFARIVPGPNGAVDQLIPLHPDLVQVFRLANGKLQYQVRSRFDAEIDYYMQEEILHLRGMSSDGLVGLSPVSVQREMIGRGLAMQDYGARFFANDSQPSGILSHPGKFKDDAARDKFKKSWQEAQTGTGRHRMAVLEEGLTYTALGLTNQDSQFLEAEAASVNYVCGMYRVPGHMIGQTDKTNRANTEQLSLEFVVHCMRPVAVRWERRINTDLIDPLNEVVGGDYFVEFLLDGLLRGDLKSRYDAYNVGRLGGWLSPNIICGFENQNKIPAEKGGDDFLRPANYVVAGAAPEPSPAFPSAPGSPVPGVPVTEGPSDPENPPEDEPDDEGSDASAPRNGQLLRAFATEAARRVVRREVTALRKEMGKTLSRDDAGDAAAFDAAAANFYEEQIPLISQTMCISPEMARVYTLKNYALLSRASDFSEKLTAIDWIEDTAPDELAATALGTGSTAAKGSVR